MWQVSEPVFANDTNGWCFTEIGPGQEVFCSRGRVKLDDDDTSPATALAQAESDGGIGKRIRWFMGNATTMSRSSFLAKHSDIVDGFYLCCFAMYVNDDGAICPKKKGPCMVEQSSDFDYAGLNALAARNLTVHVAIASSIGPTQCASVLKNKEQFARNLVSASKSLPGMNASQRYQIQGYFLGKIVIRSRFACCPSR